MNLTVRLGIVLIGCGIFFLGLRLQRGEGFQNADMPANAPKRPPEPLYRVDDLETLISKDKELRSKMNMIINTKTAADVLFLKELSSEMMTNLNIIFKEVTQYINAIYDVGKTFTGLDTTRQFTLRQMVYTASEQADMLYTIHFTIPSNIISTDSIVMSDSATTSSVSDPKVIAESAKQVSAVLAGLPSPVSKLNSYLTNIMNTIPKLTANSSEDDYTLFNLDIQNYLHTLDTQQGNLTANINEVSAAVKRDTIDSAKLVAANTNRVSFFTTSVSSLQSIIGALNAAELQSPIIANVLADLKTHLSTMQAGLVAAKAQVPKESFVSYKNPYDNLSSLQSREFSLGKKAYVDEVFAGMKFF